MLPAIGHTDEEEEGQNGNQNSEQRETEELNEEEAGGNQFGETDEDPNDDDDEEEEQIQNLGSGNNVNRQNSEENESGNQESEGGENGENQEENTSWLVVVEEVEDDEEEDEEERRRRAAEKGKQPMGDEGGISITELNDEDEDHHLDLAILKAMCDYECIIRNSPQLPTFNSRLVYVKDSFPDLKMSREALEEKIIALCKSFNDVREQLGDDPEMTRPIDREIFNLSMIIWGRR